MLLMAAYAGAGLIANDMRTGGLLLYLSRPLTLGDYIFGKAAILLVSLSMVTLIPNLVLFLGARSLAPDVLGAPVHLILIPRFIALSGPHSSDGRAGLGAVDSRPQSPVLPVLASSSSLREAVSPRSSRGARRAAPTPDSSRSRPPCGAREIFAVKPARMTADLPPELAIVTLVAMCLVCLAVLKTRVRAVEIVK